MGLMVWLDLEPADGVALFICELLGFMVGWWLWPNMVLAATAYILLSYHLFLAWLVMNSDRRAGLAMHIVPTIFTHLACTLMVYFCFMLAVSMRGSLALWPLLRVLRFLLTAAAPALAVFERGWLFSMSPKRTEEAPVTTIDPAIAAVHAAATGDDYEAWLQHLAQRNPLSRKPESSLKDEYEQFMVARVKARAATDSSDKPA